MSSVITIGGRLELLLDRHLIDTFDNATLKLNHPQRREVIPRMKKLGDVSDVVENCTGAFDSSMLPGDGFGNHAVIQCPGAEHIYISFPTRYMPERSKHEGFMDAGISDNVMISSRDGLNWDSVFKEAWIRPGLDQRNWNQHRHIVAWSFPDTTAVEFSFYVREHCGEEGDYVRRLVIPVHRFASINTGYKEGSVVTNPLLFDGDRLVINYSTSAAGSISVQLEGIDCNPIEGYRFDDCGLIYGDELKQVVSWGSGKSLASYVGKPVRIRFKMKDADLYAFQFTSI